MGLWLVVLGCSERGTRAVAGGPGLTLTVWGCWRLELALRMGVCARRLGWAVLREPPGDCVAAALPSLGRTNTAGSSLHQVIAGNGTSLSSSLPRAGCALQQDRDCEFHRGPGPAVMFGQDS